MKQNNLTLIFILLLTSSLMSSTLAYSEPGVVLTYVETDLGNGYWQYDYGFFNISTNGETLYKVVLHMPLSGALFSNTTVPSGWTIDPNGSGGTYQFTFTGTEIPANDYLLGFSVSLDFSDQSGDINYDASLHDPVGGGSDFGFNGQPCKDADLDGFYITASGEDCLGTISDCDDNNANVNPDATEGPYGNSTCSDGVDNNCDGLIDSSDSGCLKPPIVINSGAAATKSVNVTLKLFCSGKCTSMKLSNNNVTYTLPMAYATKKAWTLTSKNGTKTVYVKYKVNGRWSSAYSDTIILDTKPPVGTLYAAAGNAQVSLNWDGFTDTTGIKNYKLVYLSSGYPTSCSGGIVLYTGTNTSFIHENLKNGKTYYYRLCATDTFGRTSKGSLASAKPAP